MPPEYREPGQVAAMQQAVAELSEDQQCVLALRFGCGLAAVVVARTMGTSEAAARRLELSAIVRITERLGR